MPSKMLLLATVLLLVGCSRGPSSPLEKADLLTVPAIKEYTVEQQKKAALEMSYCDRVPTLCELVNDYGRMRDQARAALGVKVDVTR